MNNTFKHIMVAMFLIPVLVTILALTYVMWPFVVIAMIIGVISYLISKIKNRRVTV